MEFKTEYDEKNNQLLFILEHDEIKIVLSNPYIQPFNEYKLDSIDDFLYFYYNLMIYEKNKYGGRPRQIYTGYITEFGVIPYLKDFINDSLKFDMYSLKDKSYNYEPDKNGGYKLNTDEWSVSKTFELSGLLREDVFRIQRTLCFRKESYNFIKDKNEKDVYFETYELFVGGGDSQIKTNISGVILNIKKQDFDIVIKWAENFLNYAISQEQEKINKIFSANYDDINDDSKDEYYYPYLFKKYMQEKYPEDVDKVREIYTTLYSESFILQEYYKRIKGEKIEEPLFSKWENPFTVDDYIKNGAKEWEAYLKLYEEYKKIRF